MCKGESLRRNLVPNCKGRRCGGRWRVQNVDYSGGELDAKVVYKLPISINGLRADAAPTPLDVCINECG